MATNSSSPTEVKAERPQRAEDGGRHSVPPRPRGARPSIGRPGRAALRRNPVAHFVAMGMLLFVVDRWWTGDSTRESIAIASDDMARLRREWTAGHGTPPTGADENAMVERAVDEAILEREALRLALDRGDRLVRDRLAKLGRFLALGGEASHGKEQAATGVELGDDDYERSA